MEVRTVIQDWLQDCQNVHFCIEVVDDKHDECPYLLKIHEDNDCTEYWLREEDINSMVRILNKAKKERKRLIGG